MLIVKLKKIFKNSLTILFGLIVIFSFSACQNSPRAPIDLIKKPKLSAKNIIAKNIIQRELPQNAKLIRPLKPGNLNSFGYFDLDGDKKNEAYAFYKIKKDKVIGIMILKEEEGEWNLISKVQIPGTDISYGDFIDFDSDASKDLLFGSETSEGIYGVVNAYLWQDSKYQNIWNGEFSKLVIDDLNGNKNKEILCLKHDRNNYSTISVYEYSDKMFNLIDKLDMDTYINGYYNVVSGNLKANQRALFLDFNMGTKSSSNIIVLKDKKLVPLLPIFDLEQSKISLKTNDIKTRDINGDSIMEIASDYKLAYTKTEDNSSNKDIMKNGIYEWKQYRINGFTTTNISYVDKKFFYEFIFPESWLDAAESRNLTLVRSSENHKRNFVSYYYLTKNLETYHILSFEHFNKQDYEAFMNSPMSSLYEIIELNKRKGEVFIAYYNKILTPIDEYEKASYKKLELSEKQIKEHLIYLK